MKKSMGLLFLQIIQARVTAESVIEPVMTILVPPVWSKIKKTDLFQQVKVVCKWSLAPLLLHCGVSQRACQRPLKLSHIRHREDVEVQSMVSAQKPLLPLWGQTARPRERNQIHLGHLKLRGKNLFLHPVFLRLCWKHEQFKFHRD